MHSYCEMLWKKLGKFRRFFSKISIFFLNFWFFCLTVPKNFEGRPFGVEKKLSHSAEKFVGGAVWCCDKKIRKIPKLWDFFRKFPIFLLKIFVYLRTLCMTLCMIFLPKIENFLLCTFFSECKAGQKTERLLGHSQAPFFPRCSLFFIELKFFSRHSRN